MGLVTDTFRGAGNAIFALGEPFRQDSRRQLAELEGRAKERMAEAQKAAREAEEWRRKYQLESEDRAYPRAVQAFELEQKKGDADLGRQLVTLGANERAGINLYNTANAGKIAFTEADYKAQGGLDTTKSSNTIAEERARAQNQRWLQGGSFAELLGGSFGSLDAANRRDFIGSMPLAERFDASARDQQTRYIDLLKELDERDRPKGVGKFMGQLAPVIGLGAQILALRG